MGGTIVLGREPLHPAIYAISVTIRATPTRTGPRLVNLSRSHRGLLLFRARGLLTRENADSVFKDVTRGIYRNATKKAFPVSRTPAREVLPRVTALLTDHRGHLLLGADDGQYLDPVPLAPPPSGPLEHPQTRSPRPRSHAHPFTKHPTRPSHRLNMPLLPLGTPLGEPSSSFAQRMPCLHTCVLKGGMAAWRIGQVTCVTGCSEHRFVLQWVWRSYRLRKGVREVVTDMGDELERCRALGITSFACKGGGFSAERMVRLVTAREDVGSYRRLHC